MNDWLSVEEEAEKLADEFQAISNEIRDFANWSKKQG